ncbi:lactonase family protein [Paraburkholderia ferrariae]|uniref:lactonase family protein n=1 Tax=Paraburkholderia ferrariae TaxID=386056 RepID=UPI000486B359|nr:beta-propeller fold lactonase family protein [Paraburkholderia ferrariae]
MNSTTPHCFVYVSNAIDGEIAVFRLDTATGELVPHARCKAGDNVMPMVLAPSRQHLYAATRGKVRHILTWSIDAQTGDLVPAARAPIESSLAYLTIDPSERFFVGASYGEHRVSLYPADHIAAGDGEPVQVVDGIEHAHAAVISPDGRFVYVTSLGGDTVHVFALHREGQGRLEAIGAIRLDAGFGPRHLRLSPAGDVLYVLSELRAVVAVLRRDAANGRLALQVVSARPPVLAHLRDGVVRPNASHPVQPDPAMLATLVWAADLQLTPNGRFLYGSERTSSRLIAWRVREDGALDYAGCIDTEAQPRGFRIDPSGRFLVACGEKSPYVSVYSIDARSGALSPVSRCEGGRGANWVEIVTPRDAVSSGIQS